ncbi:hypothetical protein [Microvirga makkahensis]|uniref:Uncharacterized protein n=1 Tax=Microvirga makkahensis TaxID=1128670 RepID=A0A7X3MSX7_9HYPH|nr:hypothetical protein [Microvirga makkahensis]MXQ12656.1 hypothetical protein [Microvirga makkahensis]
MKRVIVATVRDEELALSACYAVEAYARRWPFVFMITDWDVWNKGKSALKLEVVYWLEQTEASHDVHLFLSGGGIVGFESRNAASQFALRWSRKMEMASAEMLPAPRQDWNPHPIKSTFEPPHLDAA